MRWGGHLPAQSDKEPVQGVRRVEHLPARSDKEPVQGVRRGEHLPAQSAKVPVQGLRREGHLPAQSDKEPVQDVRSRQGRVIAAGSRGALTCSTHAGVFVRPQGVSWQSLTHAPSLPTAQILCFCNYRFGGKLDSRSLLGKSFPYKPWVLQSSSL